MANTKKATMPEPFKAAGNQNDNVQTPNAPSFIITVKIEQAIYAGAGETALAALKSIRPPSLDMISAGSVTIVHGDKHKEMFFPGIQLKRLLNPFNQDALIGELASGM